MPTKSQAMYRIDSVLEAIPELMDQDSDALDFLKWQRNAETAIKDAFGEGSSDIQRFNQIRYFTLPTFDSSKQDNSGYRRGLTEAKAIFKSMLEQIDEYWPDDGPPKLISETQRIPELQVSNRVFVVHGRDDGTRNTVARFLENLELEPVILQDLPNEGRTIIEKFEDHSGVSFAVVLCTPDDVGALASEPENLRFRPRQNVVLELGFFLGRLGRNRVCALMDGEMEIPSDYAGVLFVPLDSADGWKLTLAKEFRAAGMTFDMNLVV